MPLSACVRTFAHRALLLAVAGSLAGCLETTRPTTASAPEAAPVTAPAPGPQGAAPPPSAAAPPPPPAAPRPNIAGRGQSPPPPPPVAAENPEEPYTIEKARGECWMKLENDRKAPRELEKRAALVEKCAQDRLVARPKT